MPLVPWWEIRLWINGLPVFHPLAWSLRNKTCSVFYPLPGWHFFSLTLRWQFGTSVSCEKWFKHTERTGSSSSIRCFTSRYPRCESFLFSENSEESQRIPFLFPLAGEKPQGWLNFLRFRKFHISTFSKTIHHIWTVSIIYLSHKNGKSDLNMVDPMTKPRFQRQGGGGNLHLGIPWLHGDWIINKVHDD